MNRKDRILRYIIEDGKKEVTTTEIAESLGLIRANVSRDLNALVRENKLVKSTGRPVIYSVVQTNVDRAKNKVTIPENKKDIFEAIIGSTGSLKTQVDQAKAALMYPPDGLNVLITGQTGSGKTYFANAMYRFAREHKLIKQDKEFTVFNCADYAHNPQLLMSHLFGYVRGAFTGAEEEKEGLIQQADGGMLFLDEVHRLPPEGQEMIFYFMDHGTFRKLGETKKKQKANVRLVCATTEDPKSTLLKTFVRRIPMLIQIPEFKERTLREQVQLLRYLLVLEANRIHKNIKLKSDVIQALIGSVTYGNVGQLKSNIQLVCAQGFLNSIQNPTEINLSFNELPDSIKDGARTLKNRKQLLKLNHILKPVTTILPDDQKATNELDGYELPYNLYEIIGDKATILKNEGLDQNAINNFILTDINVHLKSFYRKANSMEKVVNLDELVDQKIIDLTKEILKKLNELYDYNLGNDFIYAMSLHISSFIKRIQLNKPLRKISEDIVSMVKDYPIEEKMAQSIKDIIEEKYQFKLPISELYYLAILLISLKSSTKKEKVGVVVAAHGESTASSMVDVVKKLLEPDNLTAFDMPLEMSPKDAFKKIVEKVKEVNRGNGVLLLVDMGSLGSFANKLSKETKVKVKSLDMVTTAMVLEAARKTDLIHSDLETTYHELSEFNGYFRTVDINQKEKQRQKRKAIVAVCSTGRGTAEKIKEMLDRTLVDNLIDDVIVLPISVVGMNQEIEKLKQKYHVLALTGVKKSKFEIPFVPLDDLFLGKGGQIVKIIEEFEQKNNSFKDKEKKSIVFSTKDKAIEYLGEYFTFLNPKKVIDVLCRYCEIIEDGLKVKLNEAAKISLILHLGGAIERKLLNDEITLDDKNLKQDKKDEKDKVILKANAQLLKALNIGLNDDETYYIKSLINTHLKNEQIENDTL